MSWVAARKGVRGKCQHKSGKSVLISLSRKKEILASDPKTPQILVAQAIARNEGRRLRPVNGRKRSVGASPCSHRMEQADWRSGICGSCSRLGRTYSLQRAGDDLRGPICVAKHSLTLLAFVSKSSGFELGGALGRPGH